MNNTIYKFLNFCLENDLDFRLEKYEGCLSIAVIPKKETDPSIVIKNPEIDADKEIESLKKILNL